MILVIDNYDSFTYNLVQRLGEIDGALDVRVVRNDEWTAEQIEQSKPERLIVSPGPCTPNEAGVSIEAIKHMAGKVPVLGVCLGHQSMGQAYGATIVRARNLMHGKVDQIHHNGQGLFKGLESPIQATRYHSLVIDPETLSDDFTVTAWANEPHGGREIMAIQHRELPLFGVQFHPESFLTHRGFDLLRAFLAA
ncbi:aminodeoxychorismate/anthranilate synthase component II [Aeoliella sp. ICT_H6.2]|uniref:Aminodeoxychorismate/anthranilate synthase component II n=1 Tax=Aeoliella straminimaris TaxID=2954799 RepID=A0A9X2FFW5_9BACT|nr:aminodeoxychorismate/anthranilate synthase component II [Aeoliella straminimaris]MCO6044976.1 aminodeoxychorismate/anthranilate synthase component II [Aeoliella straminimaris]